MKCRFCFIPAFHSIKCRICFIQTILPHKMQILFHTGDFTGHKMQILLHTSISLHKMQNLLYTNNFTPYSTYFALCRWFYSIKCRICFIPWISCLLFSNAQKMFSAIFHELSAVFYGIIRLSAIFQGFVCHFPTSIFGSFPRLIFGRSTFSPLDLARCGATSWGSVSVF